MSVYLFRLKPREDIWGDFATGGCVDRQTEDYQHLKAQTLILRHIWIFFLPSNGINNIGQDKSLK